MQWQVQSLCNSSQLYCAPAWAARTAGSPLSMLKPRKAMGKVSVKTLRGALHPTALHWSSFPDQKTTAPVLCSLSFKEHEVSVDRGRFGNISKNETFHTKKLGGSEENYFFTVNS